jgi:hypothetical protein
MIWSIVGGYGIAWEWLGVKDIHQDTLRNSRFPQGLNRAVPIHPKPILAHAIIRVSFLWTSLWVEFPAMEPHGSTARKSRGRKIARQPVSRVLSTPREVGRPFLWDASRDAPLATNPGGGTRTSLRPVAGGDALDDRSHPYSVLLPVGFTLPPLLPRVRCALAAPFRPCPRDQIARANRSCTGGLFSVALSLGSPPPAVSRHRVPVEPGLSSACGSLHRSGRPAVWQRQVCPARPVQSSASPAAQARPRTQSQSMIALSGTSQAREPCDQTKR